MSLTKKDIEAIETLISPIKERLSAVEDKVGYGFSEVANNFDILFGYFESSRSEHEITNLQMTRFEKRLSKVEGKRVKPN